jgi:predicted negative regulator of RcsB-dependent stress response
MGTTASSMKGGGEFDGAAIWTWVVERGRALSYVFGGAVVLVAVILFYRESQTRKNERADAAFATAQSAFYSGNTALAKSDLEKLVTRYPKTASGTQASVLLAQILYGEGKYDDGISRLTAASGSAPDYLASAVEAVLAAGYADSKRYDQAVEHLNKAAASAAFPAEKAVFQAEAARMLQMAGKTAEARKVWQSLADDPESPVANEARVRLGELDAKAATR